ncbi:MAG: helix-turn-helix domain-containing protein [Thermodesulfobacteriota bacterium]
MIDNFLTICERIKKELSIKKDKDLIGIIGTSQPTFSRRKKENKFDYEWAFIINKKYNLLAEWILTGEGPKTIESLKNVDQREDIQDDGHSINNAYVECYWQNKFVRKVSLIPGKKYIIEPLNPKAKKNRGLNVELITYNFKEGVQVLILNNENNKTRKYLIVDPCDLKEI